MIFLETPEYQELKSRQDAEYKALAESKHTKRQLHRLAVKHVNQFTRSATKWTKKEVRK
jgi:hypothetical protein